MKWLHDPTQIADRERVEASIHDAERTRQRAFHRALGVTEGADTILIASHNQGKVHEFRGIFGPVGLKVQSAADLHLPEPDETGDTFEANAELKARAVADAANLVALADDSGIVVPALDGAPGIYSARWAGPTKDFAVAMERIARELRERGIEPTGAAAYFVCVLALAQPHGPVRTFRGEVHGHLTFPPRGEFGFGYDPIFIPMGDTETFGEIPPRDKNAISHRAKAFSTMMQTLNHEAAHE